MEGGVEIPAHMETQKRIRVDSHNKRPKPKVEIFQKEKKPTLNAVTIPGTFTSRA